MKGWKKELEDGGKGKVAATLGDPQEDEGLFEEGWNGTGSGTGSGVTVTDESGEGSGVMVEKEEEEEGYEVAPHAGEEQEGKGMVESGKEVVGDVLEKGKEGVEGLVDKVKDLAVGNGELHVVADLILRQDGERG